MPFDGAKMPFYAMGANLALQVGGPGRLLEEDELDIFLQGFGDTLKRTSPVDVMEAILSNYGPKMNQILQERNKKLIDKVKQEGKDYVQNFLDSNEKATRTESGLAYCETTKGEGAAPTDTSTVEVHYHGTLIDGTVFDSSVERGETISFPLNGVIKGWQEGLQLMQEGGKAVLLCPPDIAYGDQGSGDVIPPCATLKFEVELFKVSEPPVEEEPEVVRISMDDIIAAQNKARGK